MKTLTLAVSMLLAGAMGMFAEENSPSDKIKRAEAVITLKKAQLRSAQIAMEKAQSACEQDSAKCTELERTIADVDSAEKNLLAAETELGKLSSDTTDPKNPQNRHSLRKGLQKAEEATGIARRVRSLRIPRF
jgi:hypothetical protein